MLKLDILTILLVALALLLSGCGLKSTGNPSDGAYYNWPGWTGSWKERNERFTINYGPDDEPGAPWLPVVDKVWLDVQACMGVSDPDPRLIIEYMSDSNMPFTYSGLRSGAYISYDNRYIRVLYLDIHLDSNYLRHELVHYLIWRTGASEHDLSTHNSQFYAECQV